LDITKKIPHPNFPDAVFEIRHVGRVAAGRIFRQYEQSKRPFGVRNPDWKVGDPPKDKYIRKEDGSLEVALIADPDEQMMRDSINAYLVGFTGLVLRNEKIEYSPETSDVILDEDLDIEEAIEVDDGNGGTAPKTVTVSWQRHLAKLSQDIRTFFPVPTSPPSGVS